MLRSQILLSIFLSLTLASGCAQLNSLLQKPQTQNTPQAKVEEAHTSVVENPNFIEKKAEPSLGAEFENNENVEIFVYDKKEEKTPSIGERLPTFASGSEFATTQCQDLIADNVEAIAQKLTLRISSRLNIESAATYIAPTTIPSSYQECVGDLKNTIKDALILAKSPLIPLQSGASDERLISQNVGSSTLIPQLIRICRQHQIPYLVVSSIREIGGKPALTIRAVRVKDGVTLAQALEQVASTQSPQE